MKKQTDQKRDTRARGRFITILLTAVGIVLFWRGVWEISENFFSAEVSLILGLGILILVAIVERRQVFGYLR